MTIVINGRSRDFPDTLTVAELLEQLDLDLRRVAVELNRDILPRERFAEHRLRDGDSIEIVQFVGGG